MGIPDDHIFHLASGTELSVEAALGDLSRVRQYLAESNDIDTSFNADGLISDVQHVEELLVQLQTGYNGLRPFLAEYAFEGERFHRRFHADDIDHAQDQAQEACGEGEVVVGVFPEKTDG